MPRKLTKATKAKSRYNNDCSVKGVAKNFRTIRRDAAVEKPITTHNVVGDHVIYSIPIIGKGVKYYNKSSDFLANFSHAVNAYNESCKNKKMKK